MMQSTHLMDMLATRRTYRRFDQSRPLGPDVLSDMKHALRLASCGGNGQALRYVFVTDPALVEAVFPHTHWAAYLPKEVGTPKDGEHPTAYVAVLYDADHKPGCLDTDAGLAMGNLTLAAWNHGVGSCIMGNIDRPAICDILGIEKPYAIQSMVAFGYPTHTATIVDLPEDGSIKYYLDDQGNYLVPKRALNDLIRENKASKD